MFVKEWKTNKLNYHAYRIPYLLLSTHVQVLAMYFVSKISNPILATIDDILNMGPFTTSVSPKLNL